MERRDRTEAKPVLANSGNRHVTTVAGDMLCSVPSGRTPAMVRFMGRYSALNSTENATPRQARFDGRADHVILQCRIRSGQNGMDTAIRPVDEAGAIMSERISERRAADHPK